MALLPDKLVAGPLELRRWSVEALDELLDAVAASLDELRVWMPWAATMPTPESLRGVLEEGSRAFDEDREWQYVLVERATSWIVGASGLHRRGGADELEIGYWVRTDRTGRGYATHGARALTTAAFASTRGVERVRITMDQANHRSAAVPRRLGYTEQTPFEREPESPGNTGTSLLWTVERDIWAALT